MQPIRHLSSLAFCQSEESIISSYFYQRYLLPKNEDSKTAVILFGGSIDFGIETSMCMLGLGFGCKKCGQYYSLLGAPHSSSNGRVFNHAINFIISTLVLCWDIFCITWGRFCQSLSAQTKSWLQETLSHHNNLPSIMSLVGVLGVFHELRAY